MNRRLVLTASVIVVGVTSAVAWRSAQSAKADFAERSIIERRIVALEAARQSADARRQEAEAREQELSATLETVRVQLQKAQVSAPRVTAASKEPKPVEPSKLLSPAEAIVADPRLQALAIAARRASLDRTYGPLFQSLRLSPADAAKFCDIIIRGDSAAQDLMVAVRGQGLTPDDPGIAAFKRKVEDELRTAQKELLGAAGFAQLQEYDRQRDARVMVEKFAGAAALADLPLTAAQAEQATRAISNASEAFQKGGRIDFRRLDWKQAEMAMAEVLSPAQLALFQRIEPLGGGPSRWMGTLNQRMEAAQKRSASTSP
jgi:hypothetical protein